MHTIQIEHENNETKPKGKIKQLSTPTAVTYCCDSIQTAFFVDFLSDFPSS